MIGYAFLYGSPYIKDTGPIMFAEILYYSLNGNIKKLYS